jgi:hypothetical protein
MLVMPARLSEQVTISGKPAHDRPGPRRFSQAIHLIYSGAP